MSLSFKTPKTALNVTTREIQNIGSGDCPEINLESTSVEYTENGEYSVTPSEGFDGLSEVGITVNIDTQAIKDAAYAEGEADQKAKLTSLSVSSNGTYNREDGYNAVTVNVPSDIHNQEKTATPTTSSQEIIADSGYSGLSKVTVSAVTSSIDANIQANNIKNGVSILGVSGTYDPQPNLQSKSATPTTSSQTIQPDSGYDGLSQVTVGAVTSAIDQNITAGNIKSGVSILGVNGSYDPQPELQAKTVNPSTSQQTVSPDQGKDGLSSVTVNAVTSSIDANIAAGNIKDGVTILGITGTYDPQPSLESQTASYTANGTYTITPSTGYDGMSDVEVNVNVSGSNCPDWSSIGWDCNDVAASGIDADVAYTAQKLANYTDFTNGYWQSDTNLVYVPNIIIRNAYTFKGDTNLTNVPNLVFKSGIAPNGINIPELSITGMFENCKSLRTINLNLIDSGDGSESNGYVSNCSSMFSGCSLLKNVTLTNTSGVLQFSKMFYNCPSLITAPILDTSNSLGFSEMFAGCTNLESVPQYDASNVSTVESFFGSGNFNMCKKLTTLAGFTNLGKAFTGTNASAHTLTFQYNTVLTKESIMNVINNLAAPDDTAVTDATLNLSAASYALLSASDIAIATAKNWTVTSA